MGTIEIQENIFVMKRKSENMILNQIIQPHKLSDMYTRCECQNETGTGVIDFYVPSPLFFVLLIDLSMKEFSYEISENDFMEDYFMINYCEAGCCESMAAGYQSFFVKPGDCCLCAGPGGSEVIHNHYQLNKYKGVEIFIHRNILQDPFFSMLEETGISIAGWMVPLKLNPVSYAHNTQLMHVIATIQDRVRNEDLISVKIALMELLRYIDVYGIPGHTRIVHYSNTQISIVQQVHDAICAAPGCEFDIREIAAGFSISPSTLNKYFKAVYGEYIPSFVRTTRMEMAARLLRNCELSVGIIAGKTGYQHPGKFSQAFKKYYGMSPLAYRKSLW